MERCGLVQLPLTDTCNRFDSHRFSALSSEVCNDSSDDQGSYDKAMLLDAQRRDWCVASVSTQMKILSNVKAGKVPESTRVCPVP